MTFQFNAKNIFLTYPQCQVPKETLLEHLTCLLPGAQVVVAQELHEDGTPHLHALVKCTTAFRTRNKRYFDFSDHHPNIQGARNVGDVHNYVTKSGNYVTSPTYSSDIKQSWQDVLQQPSKESALNMIRTNYPRDYILNKERIEYFVNTHYTQTLPEYIPDNTQIFQVPPTLLDFVAQRREVRGTACTQAYYPPKPPPEGGAEKYRQYIKHSFS